MDAAVEKINLLYWGCIVSSVLFGVSLMQAYTYFTKNDDSLPLKTLVSLVVVFEITSTALQTEIGYHYFVRNFGQFNVVDRWTTTFIAEMFVSGLVCFLSQLFCASRVYLLMKGRCGRALRALLPGATALFSLVALSTSICIGTTVLGVGGVGARLRDGYKMEMGILFVLLNTSALLSDILATASVCFLLSSFLTDFKPSNRLATHLISFSLQRWVLISAVQTCHFVFYVVKPTSWLWVPFHLNISKLHVVSLLALLNSREMLNTPVILSSLKFAGTPKIRSDPTTSTLVGEIDVDHRMDLEATDSTTY